jgi:hypothetical protein
MASTGEWIVLSTKWEIGNVRAVLTFTINILCAIGLWVVSYVTWKNGAMEAVKASRTKLLSLLSMSSIGEAFDAISVLHFGMDTRLLLTVLGQCVLVILLSLTAILSGPIARYSVREGAILQTGVQPGWIATTNHNSMGAAFVLWNTTIERLKYAQFPPDQLLDFLPDNKLEWVYQASEWNSTWSASCKYTENTPIDLVTTGNYTEDLIDEIPQLLSVFPPDIFPTAYKGKGRFSWAGNYENATFYKDGLAFVVVQTDPDHGKDHALDQRTNHLPLNISIAAFRLAGIPRANTNSSGVFGVGPIRRSSYTLANCQISRAPSRGFDDLDSNAQDNIAFPWPFQSTPVVMAFADFHRADTISKSFLGEDVYHPTGKDLFRFYQCYLICKDTQYRQKVSRTITTMVPSVEISIVSLVVMLFYFAAIILSAIWSTVFRQLPNGLSIPRTKAQWMMQGIREVGARERDYRMLHRSWDGLRPFMEHVVYGETLTVLGHKYMSIRFDLDNDRAGDFGVCAYVLECKIHIANAFL